ncbi:unnamed protein product [Pylaiella littoralis]
MKSYTLLLAGLVILARVSPSFGRGGWSASKPKRRSATMSATVSDQDKDLIKMRAYKVAAEEMGDNADEVAMLARVEEITDKLLRESFPEAYVPAPKKKRFEDSEDIWENGTIVRYLARGMAVMLAIAKIAIGLEEEDAMIRDAHTPIQLITTSNAHVPTWGD